MSYVNKEYSFYNSNGLSLHQVKPLPSKHQAVFAEGCSKYSNDQHAMKPQGYNENNAAAYSKLRRPTGDDGCHGNGYRVETTSYSHTNIQGQEHGNWRSEGAASWILKGLDD